MLKKLFFIYDKEEEIRLKKIIIAKSGIPSEAVEFKNIYINGNKEEFIHALIIKDNNFQNKQDMLFIHGLSGSSVCYYGILRELRVKFNIYAIDMPGMGCSSRNEFEMKTFSDSENYFIERLKFVIDHFELTKFTLVGHSVGGYISGLFSIKYNEKIENLILLSPVGLSSSYLKISTGTPLEDLMKRFFYFVGSPPAFGYKILNILSSVVVNNILDNNFKDSWMAKDKDDFSVFKEFMNLLMRNYCCSEKAMFQFFDKDLRAYKTITQNYKKIKNINILCFYGDHDWNPVQHAEDLKIFIPSLKIEIVPDSGHVLYSDNNYVSMCEKIINFCEKSTPTIVETSIKLIDQENPEILNDINVIISK